MNNEQNPTTTPITIAEKLEIDRLCMAFDREWRDAIDAPPSIHAWLERVPQRLAAALFCELLPIEIEYRTKRGEACDVKSLKERFPEWSHWVEEVFRASQQLPSLSDLSELSIEVARQQSLELVDWFKQFDPEATLAENVSPEVRQWATQQHHIAQSLHKALSEISRQNPKSEWNQPQRLGDFEIIRQIGRGGMGAVFEATQLSLRRTVALKVLWYSASSDPDAIERFRREATTIANLHHTNIVPIFAVGNENGVNYYAMQLIEGTSLDKLLHTKTASIEVDSVVDWGRQAAEALAHAHDRGVIHRDVKPSNLMLDRSGRIWLTDFGLAKSSNDQSLSIAGTMLGTPRYMSPEQASLATQTVDHRSDIYSLGATLYELLSGQPVFDGDSPLRVIQQILTMEPRGIEKIHYGVPRDVATIVMKCLNKHPDDRYRTAHDLLHDLRCVCDGRPIRARRASMLDVAGKWMKRHQQSTRTAMAVLCACMLVAAALWATWANIYKYHSAKIQLFPNGSAATATIYDSDGNQVGIPISLPTQAPLELPSSPYVIRIASDKLPSVDYLLNLDPQDELKFDLNVEERKLPLEIKNCKGIRVVPGKGGGTVVSWNEAKLFLDRLNAQSAHSQAEILLGEIGKEPHVPFTVSLGSDLDGDGYDEIAICFSQQSTLHVVSRKSGFLWHQFFLENGEQASDGRAGSSDRNPSTSIRGDILQPPLLVPDQDGDGRRDILVCVGQNPNEPRTDISRIKRFVALISARDGTEIWRHDLSNSDFDLPSNSLIPESMQWKLTGPFIEVAQNYSLIKEGRFRAVLFAKPGANHSLPHTEAPQVELVNLQGNIHAVVRTGSRLRMLDLAHGKLAKSPIDTGVVPAVPFMVCDLDGDKCDDILMVEALPVIPNPTPGAVVKEIPQSRLVVWSISTWQQAWTRTLEARVPKFDSENRKLSWPAVSFDKDSLLVPNGVSHTVRFQGESLPWSKVEALHALSGEKAWNVCIPNCDSWTDQITFALDINGDSIDEVLIASTWENPLRLVVECRSGNDGSLLWLKEQAIPENTVNVIDRVEYIPHQQLFHIELSAYGKPHMAYQFQAHSGRLEGKVSGFNKLSLVDMDGDTLLDWCLIAKSTGANRASESLTIARGNAGEQWRRLCGPTKAAPDMNNDGIGDLLLDAHTHVRAMSGKTGELIWQYQLEHSMTECLFYTWKDFVPESKRFGAAGRAAWDVDSDGVPDVVVQCATTSGAKISTILVLSGRSGHKLWASDPTPDHNDKPPRLQCLDLNGDGKLEILSIENLIDRTSQIENHPEYSKERFLLKGPVIHKLDGSGSSWKTSMGITSIPNPLHSLEWFTNFSDFPPAQIINSNDDSMADLVFVSERPSDTGDPTGLFLVAVDGATGAEQWAIPLDVTSKHRREYSTWNRIATADLNGDGREVLLVLSIDKRLIENDTTKTAVLSAIDTKDGSVLWKFEQRVAAEFLDSSAGRWVRPYILKNQKGAPLVALNVITIDGADSILMIEANGKLHGEYRLTSSSGGQPDGLYCQVGDCDGDGREELIFRDGNLIALQVFEDIRPLVRFDLDNVRQDGNFKFVKTGNAAPTIVVADTMNNSVQGFEASTGKLIWRSFGPKSDGNWNPTLPPIQLLKNDLMGNTVDGLFYPLVAFHSEAQYTTVHDVCDVRDLHEEKPNERIRQRRVYGTFASISDWRFLRPLPWAADTMTTRYAPPSNFPVFLGIILTCSFLLVILPGIILLAMWRKWISQLGMLMLLAIVVAVGWLFFGTTFTVPFDTARPSAMDKISVGLMFWPVWVVVAWILSCLFKGQWMRLCFWALVSVVASVVFANMAIDNDKANMPFAEGEVYRWSWSPMILGYGFFFASWMALIVDNSIAWRFYRFVIMSSSRTARQACGIAQKNK